MSGSPVPSFAPSRSATPPLPVQPDHFFGAEGTHFPPSPNTDGRSWLDPADDPLAHRGIPVFKPSMDEFADFEHYMTRVEYWGLRSGIVKVIPPKEWVDALPPIKDQLLSVKIRSPIEQHMLGRGGLFRQENVEKRKVMSVREWAELCSKDEFRTPGVDDVGLHARSARAEYRSTVKRRTATANRKTESAEPGEQVGAIVVESRTEDPMHMAVDQPATVPMSPPPSVGNPQTPNTNNTDLQSTSGVDPPGEVQDTEADEDGEAVVCPTPLADTHDPPEKPKPKGKRVPQSREAREASLAERASKDRAFLEVFDPRKDWLPPNTTNDDYNVEFCQKLERQYWRNCGLGKPAWYGADMQGSLYTDETKIWNVAHLPSLLSRLLPTSAKGLPGVNTPYLYFGMWRATFAWHVEDMDLFSINYIHFGAPKFWYAVPQGRAAALESTMKSTVSLVDYITTKPSDLSLGYFPKDTSQCPQFLRHKSFLASPTLLAQSSCRPNFLVQREREFKVSTLLSRAGWNWGERRKLVIASLTGKPIPSFSTRTTLIDVYSVRIDVDQLLREREAERLMPAPSVEPKKRKPATADGDPKRKRPKTTNMSSCASSSSGSTGPSKISVTLKLPAKPAESEGFPCCLCVSTSRDGLLRVQDPPVGRRELPESLATLLNVGAWMAHEECAKVVPETWVDEIDVPINTTDVGATRRERRVFGVDAIVKDRWNLKCAACTKARQKAHGAPIQCTKGKCAKSFHVSCAKEGITGVAYNVLRELDKEVILVDVQTAPVTLPCPGTPLDVDVPIPRPVPPEPRVLKTIKKNEVQVLCAQHNPEIAAAKKANKQDKIRNELVALPPMSRIKIRVSAGVFEVSLVRIIEETKSVEVLWDRGIKREFKWGSVMFGSSDGHSVVQKPSELAPAPASQPTPTPTPTTAANPVPGYSSTTPSSSTTPATSAPTLYLPPHATHPAAAYGIGAWPYPSYQAPQAPHPYHPLPYTYPGYYPLVPQMHRQTGHSSSSAHGTYRSQLQWQQPYFGPHTNIHSTAPASAQAAGSSQGPTPTAVSPS
ncbi:hypothetical protein ID866_6791 [Astraeus odoratus]|nr:hypothetical protein ID866_6791 [Astraeus odoratus]